jgi:hypothetical protein
MSRISVGDLVIYRHFRGSPALLVPDPGLVIEVDLHAPECLVLWSSASDDFESWISSRNLLLVDEESFDGS